jgi:hypothetical protein
LEKMLVEPPRRGDAKINASQDKGEEFLPQMKIRCTQINANSCCGRSTKLALIAQAKHLN